MEGYNIKHNNPLISLLTIIVFKSFQGRCNRDKPPCKYFHPPQHLKDQLLINGRNHLALKNALMQQVSLTTPALMPSHHTPSMVSITTVLNRTKIPNIFHICVQIYNLSYQQLIPSGFVS